MACVLIVDDDESDRLLLQAMLEAEHELHIATNGEEALKLYLRHPIDVVVTDIQMPRGDGIELITALRGLDPDATIIAVSGQRPHKLDFARMAGAVAILPKPIFRKALLAAVAEATKPPEGEETS